MAWSISNIGNSTNTPYITYQCDTASDIADLPTNAPQGSISFVIEDGAVYVLNSIGEWVKQPKSDAGVSGSEVADIRIGYDGTEYAFAGDAVRALGSEILGVREEIVNASQAIQFISYADMILALQDPLNPYSTKLRIGQPIFIRHIGVPDLWISSINSVSKLYTYTSVDDFLTTLNTQNYIEIGIYALQSIEARIPNEIEEIEGDITTLNTFKGLFTGGDEGQVLSKKSEGDNDFEWVTQTGGGGIGGSQIYKLVLEGESLENYMNSGGKIPWTYELFTDGDESRLDMYLNLSIFKEESDGTFTPFFKNLDIPYIEGYVDGIIPIALAEIIEVVAHIELDLDDEQFVMDLPIYRVFFDDPDNNAPPRQLHSLPTLSTMWTQRSNTENFVDFTENINLYVANTHTYTFYLRVYDKPKEISAELMEVE